jgi:predicted glycosyltransferase
MEDKYYSKTSDRYFSKRLDFLIYAHDGRGLGHASRSIAVGIALRRLFPTCKTLFISGCKETRTLIGPAPLDWMKLPSYVTTLIDGQPQGRDGDTRLNKSVLTLLRSEMLSSVVKIFQPRYVLVDHAPPGKRGELRLALKQSEGSDTRWVLGLRGIIGHDSNVLSEDSIEVFKRYYHALLWYGDSAVLGPDSLETVARHFDVEPVETGYVSRLKEIKDLLSTDRGSLAGTVAIPWGTEKTWAFLENIYVTLRAVGDRYGPWHIYVARDMRDRIQKRFKDLTYCSVHEVSERYVTSLLNSKVSILYAGYNSISDVLAAQIPSVMLLRDVGDMEQERHLKRLMFHAKDAIEAIEESKADAYTLQAALEKQLHAPPLKNQGINIGGAETAASTLGKGVPCEE